MADCKIIPILHLYGYQAPMVQHANFEVVQAGESLVFVM